MDREVKRYCPVMLNCGGTVYATMNEATHGEWVTHDDYDVLRRFRERDRELVDAIVAAIEGGPVLEDYGEHPAVVAAEAIRADAFAAGVKAAYEEARCFGREELVKDEAENFCGLLWYAWQRMESLRPRNAPRVHRESQEATDE